MTPVRGKDALLAAFDRLFERAASKLNVECTAEDRDDARRHFATRYDEALRLVERAEMPAIPDALLGRMETAIDELSPASVAAHLATIPLSLHVQETLRRHALRAAEQRVLEHLVARADDQYGGN